MNRTTLHTETQAHAAQTRRRIPRRRTTPPPPSNLYRPLAMNEERTTTVREAIWHTKHATQVGFCGVLHLDPDFPASRIVNTFVVDCPRRQALKILRRIRRKHGSKTPCEIADVFGTLVLGW